MNLTRHLRRRLTGLGVADRTIARDRNALRLSRNRNLGFDRITVSRHDVAVAVELETAVAGVGQFTRRTPHLEEAFALNYHVQWIVGLLEVALGKDDFVGRRTRSQTDLQSARNTRLRSRGSSGLNETLIQQILELRPPHFEAVGVGVRKVVRDVVNVHLLRGHTAGGAIQCSDHLLLLKALLLRIMAIPGRLHPVPACSFRRQLTWPSATFRTGASR